MKNAGTYSTWVEVDLGAIESNVRYVYEHTGAQVIAIVKANAYGHGAVRVAQAALKGGAAWCGVARIEEALELRKAGLECPILLLGFTPPERIEAAITHHVSMTVWEPDQLDRASRIAKRLGIQAQLHLKVDTGMSRLGVQPEDALNMAVHLAETPAILFEGIFTHFALADDADSTPTDLQETLFLNLLAKLDSAGLLPSFVHAANSAASLTRPSSHFNLVRLGIAMYGLHPSTACLTPPAFRPALTWKTTLSQVKVLPPGRGISYGHEYVTGGHERIGTAAVGYADGYRRVRGNLALVGGQCVPVVGRVCMDQIMLQLDSAPEAREGDEVVLIGAQRGEHISAEDIALRWETINYEVVCGIGARVPRLYINTAPEITPQDRLS
jgi:alanine racemase